MREDIRGGTTGNRRRSRLPLVSVALVCAACGGGAGATSAESSDASVDRDSGTAGHDSGTEPPLDSGGPPDAHPVDADATVDGGHWVPATDTTFYWDLTNAPPDNSKNVGAYDIDGWGNTASEVATLHAKGIQVVCYMDVGTYEPGRPDSSDFPAALKGKPVQGWPGEYWLDVEPSGPDYAKLQAIMLARFQVCKKKGFDAVEPDNLDSYENDPGFPTTGKDQLAYDEWVAETVHSVGLAVFQKNDLDQISTLLPYFDGILDEECNLYSECATLGPYVKAHKPAWNAEYEEDGEKTSAFCSADVSAGIVGALFSINLDGTLFQPCSDDVGKLH